ncbi:amidohydrolase family protein [Gemmatimonadota bacterium DH-20]|uniref:Amidohydrolase family protein n=2 Tax=Gaopeijia maritima TaxID=3119007 RepID=A0ABU9E442_9BACT
MRSTSLLAAGVGRVRAVRASVVRAGAVRVRAGRAIVSAAIALAAVLLSACGSGDSGAAAPASADLVIEGVTVVDAVNGVREGRTVVVDDGRITAVLAADDPEADAVEATERVDGTGRVLIPGLWDFHVHLTYDMRFTEAMPGLFLAHGVTSIRDTGGILDLVLPVVAELEAEGATAPRVWFAGPLLDGADVVYDGENRSALGIGTPDVDAARANIAALADAGVDFVKIYEMVTPEVFDALASEASARGLPIDGHVPLSMLARDVGPRVQSLEHLRNIELDCAAGAESLLEARLALLENPDGVPGADLRSRMHSDQRVPAILDHDPARCAEVIEALSETVMVPTLRLNAMGLVSPFERDDWWATLPRLPDAAEIDWRDAGERARGGPPQRDTVHGSYSMRLIGEMNAAGVPVAAGTDTPIGYAIPGYSLHSELEMLVRSGLTPQEALFAATVRPAEWFGLEGELGLVAEGYLADLVLLSANPLDDITAVRGVEAVVTKGELLTRAELDALMR